MGSRKGRRLIMEQIILSHVSNETLLDMYWNYKNMLHRYQKMLDGKLDKKEREYYYDKLVYDGEYFHQIKLECLRRMSGLEID